MKTGVVLFGNTESNEKKKRVAGRGESAHVQQVTQTQPMEKALYGA